MRELLIVLSAAFLFLLSSCSKEVQLVTTSFAQDPVIVEEKGTIELRLSPMDLSRYVDVETGIWQEARDQGLPRVFQKLINKNIVVTPVEGTLPLGSIAGEYAQHGLVSHQLDEETGDLVQNFMMSVRFVGDLDLGGEVITIEQDRYVAGMHDVIYAIMYETIPASLPAYVAIARPLKELGSSFYQVTGVAEIQQIEGNEIALPLEKGGAMGTLCSLVVVSSGREVEPGDKIFLLSVDLTALDKEVVRFAGDPETIIVQPPHVDTIQEPTEHK
ncbi:MAG: hypothetical protein RBR42_00420 [Desulfomicrobium sp.]|jgi:hypothetical protein|nr:hypothetical protein [Desulfomicrobium sp.]NLV97577.1 hypothetical protein [Desulfovibrionales bacterium]